MKECKHNFKYSHSEAGGYGTTTELPKGYDVVVCVKCGEIRRSEKQITENKVTHDRGGRLQI